MSADLMARCRAIATSTWSDALDELGIRGVIDGLTLRSGAGRIAGPAITVKERVGDFPREAFAIDDVLEAAASGGVLAIDLGGEAVSTFGGLAGQGAAYKHVAGAIIDGACRDLDEIRAAGLWLASRHVTPLSGKTRVKTEAIGVPVTIGGVSIDPGDCIAADETGIVRIPAGRLAEALAIAEELTARDAQFAKALRAGDSFRTAASRLRHL